MDHRALVPTALVPARPDAGEKVLHAVAAGPLPHVDAAAGQAHVGEVEGVVHAGFVAPVQGGHEAVEGGQGGGGALGMLGHAGMVTRFALAEGFC